MLAGAVLTGGSSSRMGSDKALLEVGGTPMALRVLNTLRSVGCAPVVLVGGDARSLGALGATIVDDIAPGEGPAGGIISALRALAGADHVFIVSCDLPYLLPEHLRPLIDAMDRETDVVQVAVATAERLQPLCALWRPSVLPVIEAAFASGVRSVHGLLDVVRVSRCRWRRRASATSTARPISRCAHYPAPVAYGEITVDELIVLGDTARVIDVRESDEWDESHIPWAVHVPLAAVPERLDQFDGGPTYVVCRSGARSGRACAFAADRGLDTVNVVGGMLAWWDAGFATDRGDADG